MKNVTVTIDERTARWARLEATRRGISLSAMIREQLQRQMRSRESYSAAMERFLAREPRVLKRKGRYPRRDQLGRSLC